MLDLSRFTTHRRGFLGGLAAAALGATGFAGRHLVAAPAPGRETSNNPDFEKWLDGITGKHRQVVDATAPADGFGLIMSYIWLTTQRETYGLDDSALSAVLVLRHAGIALAFGDDVYAKYKLGEQFNVTDPATKAPALRNPFAHVRPGEFPPFPDAAVEKLLARGVKIGVCNVALTLNSARAGQKLGIAKDDAKKEWVAGLLPGAMVVPSGVLALNRAQEHGCTYCSAAL
jgi:intracellular sulfur oxidation DsrE/DsrF family protein